MKYGKKPLTLLKYVHIYIIAKNFMKIFAKIENKIIYIDKI